MSTLKQRLWESDDPFIAWLRDERGLSATTLYHYNTYYKEIKKLDDLNQKTLQGLIQKKKNNSIVRSTVSLFIEWLKSQEIVIEFEMPKQPTGRKKKKMIQTYTNNQMDQVRQRCYKKNQGYGLMFDLLYYGALRRAEVQTIKYNSFDWGNYLKDPTKHCACKVEGKGKKERVVLIPQEIMGLILQHLMKLKVISCHMDAQAISNIISNNHQPLFNNIYEWKVWKVINSASKVILDVPMRPHEIRHHRATELQNMGVNIRDIQHYLGHSSPQITEIYLHTTEKTSLKNIRGVIDNE